MVNCQRLTPMLTTTFFKTNQPIATQNTFAMSFLDNFSRWNKLDTNNQTANLIGIIFPMVKCKIRKKKTMQILFMLS